MNSEGTEKYSSDPVCVCWGGGRGDREGGGEERERRKEDVSGFVLGA